MRANLFLQPCVLLLLASSMASIAQPRPCSAVPADEREAARASGACTDAAPTDQVSPKKSEPAPVVIPIPNVVGLTLDDARGRLSGFLLRRAYRASAEPGGTVLEQQPASPARGTVGSVINVVVSDGTLRPAGEARPNLTQPGVVQPMPQVVGMPIAQAQARLREFRIERVDRPNNASIGEVIAQSPKALESIARGQPITLIVSSGPADSTAVKAKKLVAREVVTKKTSPAPAASSKLPQVSRPIGSDPSNAPAESKIERVDVPSAASQGEVPTQDAPADTSVTPDTTAPLLPASDGSLAGPAATPPVVAPELAPLTAPAPVRTPPQAQLPITLASNTALTLGAGIVLGALMGAWLTRRRLLNRRPTVDAIAPEPTGVALVDAAADGVPVAGASPGVTFDARLDEGETTIEFATAADVDADQDADEMTVEPSGDIHA